MKHPIITSIGLAVLAGISLVTPASATLVDYSITGTTPENNWSGQFDVIDLNVSASDWMLQNVQSISANGWDPILSTTPYMYYFGSGGLLLRRRTKHMR